MSVNVQSGVKWGVTVLMGAVLVACGGGGGTPTLTPTAGSVPSSTDTTAGTGTTGATTATGGSTTTTTTGTTSGTASTGTSTTSGTAGTGSTSGTTTGTATTGTTSTTTTGSGTGSGTTASTTTTTNPPCTLFPATAVFNSPIMGSMPVHAQSENWKAQVGNTVPFHPDWGNSEDQTGGAYYGIPTNTVNGSTLTTSWPQVNWNFVIDESDCATQNTSGGHDILRGCTSANLAGKVPRFPFPSVANTKFEGGTACTSDCGDRHVLVIETAQCRLWEAASVYNVNGAWTAYGGAAWNLRSLDMRPDTWSSADAAGLPIAPLLVKASEASGEIKHALRVTLQDRFIADRLYTWPASHRAGSSGGVIPMGAAMRLKASFVPPSTWNAQSKAIVLAMQRYGLYVADNGSNMFVQGEPSVNWNDKVFDELKTLKMADFEFVDLAPITTRSGFNPRSYAASW